MKQCPPIRYALAGLVLLAAALPTWRQVLWSQVQQTGLEPQSAQNKPSPDVLSGSSLPASQPTGSESPQPAAPEPPAPRVAVEFADGRLSVDATGGSLNQILREVANKTGLKISGGVAEERVFGTYGPDRPGVILAALLEGTGSNMLLVDDPGGASTLLLTPRRGGVTPPNPNAAHDTNPLGDTDLEPRYIPPSRPFVPPARPARGPVAANADGSPSNAAPAALPDAEDNANNSETVPKSSQDIYEQLVKKNQQLPSPPQ